jgi:FkbM family methyltransferase
VVVSEKKSLEFDMVPPSLIQAVQSVLRRLGYQINKLPHRLPPTRRPVGQMPCFLEDVAARGFAPRSILDVGANKGDWSRMAAAVYPNASFLLIEPQHEMHPHLEQFCRDFPKARRVEAGAGATEGELTLTLWEDTEGSSFLPEENTPLTVGKKRCNVKIVTIDSLYDGKTDLPDLVKLDIQGFELEALKGAQTLFGRTELFILEVSLFECTPHCPLFSEVVGFMAQRGYEVYDLPGFMRRPFDAALGQADIAFARRDGFLRASNAW